MSRTLIKLTNGASYTLDANNDAYDSEDGDIRLVGFQDEWHTQRVNLFVEDWRKGDLQAAVGKFPVFSRGGDNGIFAFIIPVESVTVHPEADAGNVEDRISVSIEREEGSPAIVWVRYGDLSLAITETVSERSSVLISVENVGEHERVPLVLSTMQQIEWEGSIEK